MVFGRLTAILGYDWTKQFNDETTIAMAKDEWGKVLQDYHISSIAKAIDFFARNKTQGILNLPKFSEACRDFERIRNLNSKIIQKIENHPSSPESISKALKAKEEIRNLLNLKKPK
jgi:hypothetical protein